MDDLRNSHWQACDYMANFSLNPIRPKRETVLFFYEKKNRNTWCPKCADPNKMNINDLLLNLCSMRDDETDILKKRILIRTINYINDETNVK